MTRTQHATYYAKRRKRELALGKCGWCLTRERVPGSRFYCASCLVAHRDNARRRTADARDARAKAKGAAA